MGEFRKSVLLSLAVVVLYCLWLSQQVAFLKDYWRVVIYGRVSMGSSWTNLEALGLLLGGLFLLLLMLSMLLLRRLTYRESGGMLQHTHREMHEIAVTRGIQRRR
jgi:hypothetical protein